MYSCVDPICMYPTNIPKDDKVFHPVLLGTVTKSKADNYGVNYFHFFSVLMQEISFDVDDQFLITLMEFFKIDVGGEADEEDFDTDLKLPSLGESETDLRMYFERFFLQPVKINVSFARTLAKSKGEEERPRSQNILSFIFDVFTMAVGNIHVFFLKLIA
jgi:vacuolar protein sorting-associated protein 13A/C